MSPVQDTERSQRKKKSVQPKRITLPLPLEIVFRPGKRGVYDLKKVRNVDLRAHTANPPWEGFAIDGNAYQAEFIPQYEPIHKVEDPWLMRIDILDEEWDDPVSLDAITVSYGRFGVGREDIYVPVERVGQRSGVHKFREALCNEFIEWRSLIRAAMTTDMGEWPRLRERLDAKKVAQLCRPIDLTIAWQEGRPSGIISCSGIFPALIATVQIDALMHSEYRFCGCNGCSNSFKVKRKDQRYCSDECKHKQVVRDGRTRQRETGKQSSIRTKRGKKS